LLPLWDRTGGPGEIPGAARSFLREVALNGCWLRAGRLVVVGIRGVDGPGD